MSNTVIQIKHSVDTGVSPVSLVNGEIALNTFDGKLFYADPAGDIQSIQNFPGPAGLDTEVQFNDSGTLGANAGLTFDKTTGNLSATYLHTGSFVEFGDGTKQYTANAGGGGGGSGPTVTVDTSPPASGNVAGDLWIDSNTGVTFTWLDDSDSFQWVELGPSPSDGLTIYSGDLTVSGNILPSLNVTYDLGSPTERWRDIYLSGSTINLGGATIQIDSVSGAIALVPSVSESIPSPTATIISPSGFISFANTTAGVITEEIIGNAAAAANAPASVESTAAALAIALGG